jgi:hypothetical protein
MKFGIKYYFSPTPHGIKKVADSLLAAIGGGGCVAAINNFHPKTCATLAVMSIVAKFISQCFTAEQKSIE